MDERQHDLWLARNDHILGVRQLQQRLLFAQRRSHRALRQHGERKHFRRLQQW